MKRRFALLAAGLLLGAFRAAATTGGDSSADGFCLEPGGRRILYLSSDGGESGCYNTLHALDVRTGRSTVVMACDSDEGGEKRRQKLLQGCTPLVPRSLSTLGLAATIASRGAAPTFTNPPDEPSDLFAERAAYAQRLELSRNGAPVGGLSFDSCVFASAPKVAWLTLLVLPKKPFGLLTVTHPGSCYESGYLRDELVLLPSLFQAGGGPPSLQGSAPVPVAIALKPPDVELSELFLKVAQQLERANRRAAAQRYREQAGEIQQRALARALESGVLDAKSSSFHAQGTALELEPGARASVKDCRTTSCAARPVDSAPLHSEWLDALGITASVRRAGKPQVPEPTGNPLDFNVGCPQELVLTRMGAPLAAYPFTSACPLRAPARLVAWPVPQKKLTVFMLTAMRGDPREAPSELFAVATPGVKASARTGQAEGASWLPLDLPAIERSQLLNDAGMALYRKQRLDEATAYFAEAWANSYSQQPRLFIALFNQAATLARLGGADSSLALLRQLLSFSAVRERFITKVRSDDDFASLRRDARLEALLTEPDCCVEAFSQGQPEWARGVVRWTNGDQVSLQRLEFHDGKKVSEFDADAGFARAWYESGPLRSEEVLVRGEKNGPSRTWDEAGHLLSETTWADGLKSGLERTWSSTGQLLSETTFEDGALTGRQRSWFSTGNPKADYQLVEGRINGPYGTWYESGQPENEALIVDGGTPGETVQWRRWSETGQLLSESWTVGGVASGTWREWYESGQLKSETRYEKGVKRGQARTWAEDGGVATRTR